MGEKCTAPKKMSELMQEFGFRPEAANSTARALIINLVRSAYGAEAAKDFIRQMNLMEKRDDKLDQSGSAFTKSSTIQSSESPKQLPLFKGDGFSGTGTDA